MPRDRRRCHRRHDRDRRRRRHCGPGLQGDPGAQARHLDGPGTARHARCRDAVRAGGAEGAPGQAGTDRFRRRLVRAQRLRVRHCRAIRPAHRGSRGQRRCVGPDAAPAGWPLRPGPGGGHRAQLHPLRQGG